MNYSSFVAVFMSAVAAWGAASGLCEPDAETREELKTAAAVLVTAPMDFDQNVAAFLEVRARHPKDLFAHERYQDAVHQYGIEGHLRALTEEYRSLSTQHSDDVMYRYLYARTLIGRTTLAAIRAMTEIIVDHPDFAPAHRTLAETYLTEAFNNAEGLRAERERFQALCPGAAFAQRPPALADPSPLVDRAARLLVEDTDPEHVSQMALEGVRNDEWRLQRIRPFDWYSDAYKGQNERELGATYWKVWSVLVRCYRKEGRLAEAAELLASMKRRATVLRERSDPAYWDAQIVLVRLCAEADQREEASQQLHVMERFLAAHPDPSHAVQLEDLQELIMGRHSPER
jgi:pentatricopeptide repeat protein